MTKDIYEELKDRVTRAEEIQQYTENRCEVLEKENQDLKAQIEKMMCCQNCSHLCSRCELGIDGCYVCSKWELRK